MKINSIYSINIINLIHKIVHYCKYIKKIQNRVGFLALTDAVNLFEYLNSLNASRKCFGWIGPASFHLVLTSKAFSTISPTYTLAIPDIAITTDALTVLPQTVWMIYLNWEV